MHYIYKLHLIYFIRMDEGRQPLSRKLPIPSSRINPYRMIIILRLVILGLFFHYRILHPVKDAYGLWLTSVICEIWFAVSWILDQFPKWYPIERETYLDRLSLRLVNFFSVVLSSFFVLFLWKKVLHFPTCFGYSQISRNKFLHHLLLIFSGTKRKGSHLN